MRPCHLVLPPLNFSLVGHVYASLPVIASYLARRGAQVEQFDLNTAFVRSLLDGEHGRRLYRRARGRVGEVGEKEALDGQEFETYTDSMLCLRYLDAPREQQHALLPFISRDAGFLALHEDLLGYSDFWSVEELLGQARRGGPAHKVYAPFFEQFYSAVDVPPRLVGISVPFSSLLVPALILAETLRGMYGDRVHIVFGGPAMTLLSPADMAQLARGSSADSFVLSEGEDAFLHLYNLARYDAESLASVPRLVYRDGPHLVYNPPGRRIRLNDSSPMTFDPAMAGRVDELPVVIGRGCFMKCTFCDYINLYTHFDLKDVWRVVEEVRRAVNTYGVNRFHFIYEALPARYMRNLCQAIVDAGLRIRWRGFQRVEEKFDAQMIALLEAAGCSRLDIGLESADDDALTRMDKGYSQQQIKHFYPLFRGSSVQLLSNIIVDYPGLTHQQALDAYRFLAEVVSGVDVHFEVLRFVLTKTSEMYRQAPKYKLKVDEEAAPARMPFATLPLNVVRFEADERMSAEQADDIAARYNHLNYRLASERSARLHERLGAARRGAADHEIVLTMDSGPYLSAVLDFGPSDDGNRPGGASFPRRPTGILRNLSTRQTYLVGAEMLRFVSELISERASRVPLGELLSRIPARGVGSRPPAGVLSDLIDLQIISGVQVRAEAARATHLRTERLVEVS